MMLCEIDEIEDDEDDYVKVTLLIDSHNRNTATFTFNREIYPSLFRRLLDSYEEGHKFDLTEVVNWLYSEERGQAVKR